MNETRATTIRSARIYIGEAARRRHHPANKEFYWTLLKWAANARRRAAAIPVDPEQRELFA